MPAGRGLKELVLAFYPVLSPSLLGRTFLNSAGSHPVDLKEQIKNEFFREPFFYDDKRWNPC